MARWVTTVGGGVVVQVDVASEGGKVWMITSNPLRRGPPARAHAYRHSMAGRVKGAGGNIGPVSSQITLITGLHSLL